MIYKPSSRPEGPAGGDMIGANRVEASGSTRWGVRRGEKKHPERGNNRERDEKADKEEIQREESVSRLTSPE